MRRLHTVSLIIVRAAQAVRPARENLRRPLVGLIPPGLAVAALGRKPPATSLPDEASH